MNYKEQITPVVISGEEKKWVRTQLISILNNYGQIPEINFMEEEITVKVDNTEVHNMLGSLRKTFDDPLEEFDLLNPMDDSVIGKTTLQQLQVILYSLYFHLVNQRDAEKTETISVESTDQPGPVVE